MDGQNLQENQSAEPQSDSPNPKWTKPVIIGGAVLLGLVVIAVVFVGVLIPRMTEVQWTSNTMIAMYIAVGLAIAAVGAWLILRRTVRTRLRMQKVMKLDPDINDWLVIFNWTPKILYAPTIIASLAACLLV